MHLRAQGREGGDAVSAYGAEGGLSGWGVGGWMGMGMGVRWGWEGGGEGGYM